MKRIKTGLTGFILGDWLGMPYRGKGKGTFKPMWTKSYLRGDKCSGNTSMLLCALDSRCNLELYQQNLIGILIESIQEKTLSLILIR